MSTDEIKKVLLDAGFDESPVEKLIDEYNQMGAEFQNGEYAGVGRHSGRFCEAVIHILRYEIDDKYKTESVREFATAIQNRNLGNEYSESIQQHLPNMLHTAWDIRSNRDAAHMNLEVAVNRADAKLSLALCSSMLVELIREFGSDNTEEEINQISGIIDNLSVVVEENPLQRLVTSKYEFDRERVAETLDGIISIVAEDEEIKPGVDFFEYQTKQQVIAMALGRLAANDLGVVNDNEVAKNADWFEKRIDSDSVSRHLTDTDYIEQKYNKYHIPGYQVENAIGELQ